MSRHLLCRSECELYFKCPCLTSFCIYANVQERQRRKDAKHDYDRQALRKQVCRISLLFSLCVL